MTHLADRNPRRRGALQRAWRDDGGFSLVELLVICAIAGIAMTVAIFGLGGSVSAARSRGAIAQVKLQIQNARELSISQQRDIRIDFVPPDKIQVTRINRGSPAPAPTLLSELRLEGGMEFRQLADAPVTPDAWGGDAGPVAFGAATSLRFRSGDGALVDQNDNFVSGRVFLGHLGGKRESFGVVSVFGPTGRVRSYRLTGNSWQTY
jgi:type II secretory pathway pseudopilin PulG